MSQARHRISRVVVASVVILAACIADASEINRWEVDTFEEMSSVIQQCYVEKDVNCIMDFVYEKGVPHNLVEDLRSKLTEYVEHRTLAEIRLGPQVKDKDGKRYPRDSPGLRFEERIEVSPTFSPVIDVVYFEFAEPQGTGPVWWYETWRFWMAVDQGAAHLVLEVERPFELSQSEIDAFMMEWLSYAWWRSDWLVNEIEEVIPGHEDETYHEMLTASFLRLHDAGFAVVCPTEAEDQPWWMAASGCPNQQDPQMLIETPGFWNVDPEASTGPYYWFTLTEEGEVEEENEAYETTRDRVDDLLDGRTSSG